MTWTPKTVYSRNKAYRFAHVSKVVFYLESFFKPFFFTDRTVFLRGKTDKGIKAILWNCLKSLCIMRRLEIFMYYETKHTSLYTRPSHFSILLLRRLTSFSWYKVLAYNRYNNLELNLSWYSVLRKHIYFCVLDSKSRSSFKILIQTYLGYFLLPKKSNNSLVWIINNQYSCPSMYSLSSSLLLSPPAMISILLICTLG